MLTDNASPGSGSLLHAVRHHLVVVLLCCLAGGLGGWLYLSTTPTTHTSTASVLVNPSSGNPYAPTPSSVRQDELTSLETEAQVARSVEVLAQVADDTSLSVDQLESGLQVVVPPNTQVLQISYTALDPAVAQQVTDAVATTYLENRDRRFEEVNTARIERIESRTLAVVDDLRAATTAAQEGRPADRLFQNQLADALSNELVSLRAQRTALENSESPGGSVVSPASTPVSSQGLTSLLLPVIGLLVGLALGGVLALLLERTRGVVRGAAEVEGAGLPVIAAVPHERRRARLSHPDTSEAVDTTVRRLRAAVLDQDPRPDVIAVTPAGSGRSDAAVTEAVAESFAKAGHRVVLVQTETPAAQRGLAVGEHGLAQALMHERLAVLDMLQPSVDPLLSLLPDGGFDEHSRELLIAERLRSVLAPLVAAGHLVVIQAPGIDSAEGEAVVGAADLGLVVVTTGRTRPGEVARVRAARTRGVELAALVVGRLGSRHRVGRTPRHGRRHQKAGTESVTTEEVVGRSRTLR